MTALSFSAMADDWTPVSIAPNPEDVVVDAGSFENVRINYGSDWSFTVAEGAVCTLKNTETNEEINSTSVSLWDVAKNLTGEYYLRIVFPKPEANGTYKLTVPAGVMTHEEGNSNAEFSYTYTLNDPSFNQEELPELELNSVDPAAGSALPSVGLAYDEETTPDGRVYTLDTNLNDKIGYMWVEWYDVTDPENPEWIASTDASHALENTSLVIKKIGDADKMYENHTYKMEVTCYNGQQEPRTQIGVIEVQYTGSTPAYVYSDITLTSVSPDPDVYVIESVEQGTFTVTFSGAVEIDSETSYINGGYGTSISYASITSNDEKTEWTFVIPESTLKSMSEINCWVAPHDAEGRTLRAGEDLKQFEFGSEESAGFQFNYKSDMTGAELTVSPEANSTVTSLSTFTLTAEGYNDIAPSWNYYPYVVYGRETVYTFDLENDVDNSDYSKMVLKLPEELTEAGVYMLVVPRGTFNLSSSMGELTTNKPLTALYTIEPETVEVVYDLEPQAIDPADNSQVEKIEKVTITFPEGEYGNIYYDALLLNEQGEQVAKGDVTYDWDAWNVFYATFNPAITDEGTYTLCIPEGTFGDLDYADNAGDMGHGSKEIRVTYTVKSGSVAGIAAEELTGDVYNVAGVLVLRDATAAQIQALDKGLYIVNGKKVLVK